MLNLPPPLGSSLEVIISLVDSRSTKGKPEDDKARFGPGLLLVFPGLSRISRWEALLQSFRAGRPTYSARHPALAGRYGGSGERGWRLRV